MQVADASTVLFGAKGALQKEMLHSPTKIIYAFLIVKKGSGKPGPTG